MESQLKVFSGRSNRPLADKICKHLDLPCGAAEIRNFADGEIRVNINENVRGTDVFVIQSTQPPADNLLELLLMIDALRRASAERVTAVIPYYGYGRQDRKDEPRVPLSAKLIANLISRAGADRVLTLELHADQIQAFFDIPVDHLYSLPVFIEYFPASRTKNMVVVAPDTGRANRARGFASRIGSDIPIAIVDKRRPKPNMSEVATLVGEVSGHDALILDDMIDTAGTLVGAAKALAENGTKSITALATHGVLSGPAIERLAASDIDEVIITDTIDLPLEKRLEKIKVLSVSSLLAEAVFRIHRGESVSSLFV
ncbi:MAG: ribose-phosphate pyrophosphokinase [candidate division WOR-3 bacterium]|nr:MAG: ribose-phosphate pyrophosphokinase [candidate division WOR-3 bacterium]